MKKTFYIILTFFVFLLAPSVSAQTVMQGESVVVPKDRVINENYFAGGDNVIMSGTVNGDAYVAGGSVYVDGTVNGDLLVVGGTVNVVGEVTGDIRGAGGQINISGSVDGNITLAGGTINISEEARIGKGLVGASGQMNIMAPLGKGAVIGAGQLALNNTINGNVMAGVGTLMLNPKAKINGDLTYYSEEQATISPGAMVSGKVDYHQQRTYKPERDNQKMKETAAKAASAAYAVVTVYSLLTAFIAGSILIRLAPRFMQHSVHVVRTQPWMSMGIGLLMLIMTPIVGVMLIISIVGIPFALFLLVMYIFIICMSKIFVSIYVGNIIIGWFKWEQNMYFALFLGLLSITLVTAIPVFGWLLGFLVTLIGIGALLITKKEVYVQLREKNCI